jgi:hypothetical protein
MSEAHHAPETANHDAAHVPSPFTEAEWQEFHAEDVHAGGAIVCLMAGILTIGMVMYATIAVIVGT